LKVALINPDNGRAIKKENIGLLALATFLDRNGVEVRLIDEVAGDKTLSALRDYRPHVAGLSCMTMFAPRALFLAGQIREHFPDVKIVFGGAHPSALPESFDGTADAVVVGEGEHAFLKLLRDNCWNRKIIPGTPEPDIDRFPVPDRRFINTAFYLKHKMGVAGFPLRALSLSTSRGCPYQCLFCENSKRRSPVRVHGVERVLDEMEALVRNHAVESVAFTDENFSFNKQRLQRICRGMVERGLNKLRWECQTSADRVDEEVLSAMKAAGAVQVAFGFESGSQRVLDTLGKNATVEQNQRAVRLARKAGLSVRGCFMIGNPGETLEDLILTEKFILESDIHYTGVFITTPYPGTRLWDLCEERGAFPPEGPDYASFTTGIDTPPYACDSLDPALLRSVYSRLVYLSMRKNYSRPRLLLKALQHPAESFRLFRELVKRL